MYSLSLHTVHVYKAWIAWCEPDATKERGGKKENKNLSPLRQTHSEAEVVLPAGQKRCSGPSYMAKFWATGMLSSFRVKCGGWSPSWLVPLSATEESRSKLILPSGLGYSIGVQSLAGFSWCASRPERQRQSAACYEMLIYSAQIRRPRVALHLKSTHTHTLDLVCSSMADKGKIYSAPPM